MKPTSKRILFVLLALLCLIGAVMVYSSLIQDAYSNVVTLRGKLASETDALNRYQTTLGQVRQLIANLQNAANVQQQASLILPKDRNVGYLVSQVVGLAQANGLSVDSITTQVLPVQASKSTVILNIGRMKADVKISGSYSGFKSFVRQLETNMLILDMTDLKIDGAAPVSGKTIASLNYTFSIVSYYQTTQ